MATVTNNLWSLDDGAFVIDSQYDDVTHDFDWMRVRNLHATRSYKVEWVRGNGRHWQTLSCPPGYDQTFNSGGPIRNLSDFPTHRVSAL